jgi:hypothetical protein
VFFGKSSLTKALTRGAFGVSTKLTMDQVRDAAGITCGRASVGYWSDADRYPSAARLGRSDVGGEHAGALAVRMSGRTVDSERDPRRHLRDEERAPVLDF